MRAIVLALSPAPRQWFARNLSDRVAATPWLRPVLELSAVALTATLHLSWPSTGLPRAALVFPMVAVWIGYIVRRYRQDPQAVAAWGLRREGLLPTSLATAAVMAVGGTAMGLYGWRHGAELPPWYAAVVLLSYPVFGLVQQLIVQGLVTGNLSKLPGKLGHPAVATLLSASLFGLVHWPETELMIGTFFLGLAFAPIWMRWRNLFPLAVAHGWLGMAIFYIVLQRDPLMTYFS